MQGGGNSVGAQASHTVYTSWPEDVPIVYSGGEVGEKIQTAGPLYDRLPASNPVKAAYADFCGYGNTRPSWDPLTVLIAIRGVDSTTGCSVCKDCNGKNSVDANGNNQWIAGAFANQSYIVLD